MSATGNTITLATGYKTPSAGGVVNSAVVNSADARASVASTGVDRAQSTGPARSSADLRQPTISFTSAYWDYLRRITPDEPAAADYGLEEPYAEVLRRQCVIEFTDRKVAAARAASTCQARSERSVR